jgi:hypothetical protein
MNLDEIIVAITHWKGDIPEEAFKEAENHKRELIPELITLLKTVTADPQKYIVQEDYWGHISAILLLSQFQEKSACKTISDFFSLPDEVIWELTGEMVTEELGKILASVCNGDLSLIKGLIESEAVDSFVRAAGIDCLLVLLASGKISRNDVVSYFKELYLEKLQRKSSLIWNHLVISSVNIHPKDMFEEIERAFKDGLIDRDFINLKEVEAAMDSSKDEILTWLTQNKTYSMLQDSLSALKNWNSRSDIVDFGSLM